MGSYSKKEFEEIRKRIDAEVREGRHRITASFIASKHGLDVGLVQQILSALAALGDLRTNYQVLCSGPNQRFDVDREYSDRRQIPTQEIMCQTCGDRYVPDAEHVLLSFEPTEPYLEALGTSERASAH